VVDGEDPPGVISERRDRRVVVEARTQRDWAPHACARARVERQERSAALLRERRVHAPVHDEGIRDEAPELDLPPRHEW
jgi:hypothetical protein